MLATRSRNPLRLSNKPSEMPRDALQPKPTSLLNAHKRSLEEKGTREGPSNKKLASSKAFRENGKSKARPVTSVSPESQETASLSTFVTGHYVITISEVASHHKFDTSSYTLALFQHTEGDHTQFYADFKFDNLEGTMRLMPTLVFNAKGATKWTSEDFIKYCKLPKDTYPSPEFCNWLMRWRGVDGGMRLNEKVRGEPWNAPGTVNFKFDTETTENGVGLKFDVVFAYDCKLFSFSCTKVRDLDTGVQIVDFIALQQLWDDLEDLAWYEDEESESEANYEGRSDSIANRMDLLASASKRDIQSPPKIDAKRPKAKRARKVRKESIPEWDVSGLYKLTCMCGNQLVDASAYELRIHYRSWGKQQLYGQFSIDDLKGVMRLCPAEALTASPRQLLSLEDFEAACDLDDHPPGPKTNEWLMRWRGKKGTDVYGGEARAQGQFNFFSDPASSFQSTFGHFPGFKVVFTMYYDGKQFDLEGIKTAHVSEPVDFDLEHEWGSLFLEE